MFNLLVQVRPSPEYPAKHVQTNEPVVSLHAASLAQLWPPVKHSLTFVQDTRGFPEKPVQQVQRNEPSVFVQFA